MLPPREKLYSKHFRRTSRKELWYLKDDDGDDGHLGAEPREETL